MLEAAGIEAAFLFLNGKLIGVLTKGELINSQVWPRFFFGSRKMIAPTTKRVHKKRKLRITIRNKYKVYGTD